MTPIERKIEEILEEIICIRRDFHTNPELSEYEVRTAQKISEYLTAWEIPHQTGVAGNGIVALLQGKKVQDEAKRFQTIGIRADMDALPIQEAVDVPFRSVKSGVMHACGHDIHTAILLGTARIFKELEEDLTGNVKFFFQPSEETVGGAERMIQEGCMENPKVDVVIGLHVAPEIPVGCIEFCKGKMNAASTEFKIWVEGIECHGAHPETGIDPIVAASHIVCALQSIVSRNTSPTQPTVITVAQFHAGKKNNIIPKEAVLSGIIRTLNMKSRTFLKKRVEELAVLCAESFGAKARVQFTDSYPVLINDEEIESILEKAARQFLPKNKILHCSEPSMGADDFSYFSRVAKTVYFNIGTLSEGESVPQRVHSAHFNPDEQCIEVGMTMEILGTLELLSQKKK
ncbi:M20 metallopeptidase family protein [Clostridium aminobutyricum]|uniref:Amidohydrolase n=1 Tax=Clostridium aminobutyricum TaxID=33953 RepID=A0A939D825_CLOAM|nr:M20 family metallopeptidase [Clostridium aminobutyricum]MBN7773214.1 amidohydrolase [Clostridium aminobutyricum]